MKILCTTAILLCSTGISAQILHVDSVKELVLAHPVEKVEIAPTGRFLLLTDYNYKGLTRMDLATQEEKIVTAAAGAGYRTKILRNGDIIYREVTRVPQRVTTIKRYVSDTENTTTVVTATQKSLLPANVVEENSVETNEDFLLELTLNGEKRVLSPLGKDKRYIWPSISPDGKKLLFFVSAQGAYVCDLNGDNVVALGILRAAKWYNNSIVVGQRDKDNGVVTTSSQIIAKNITTGLEQVLTGEDIIAMYPSVAGDEGKILFSTPEGKAYLIHVNTK